MTRSFKEALQRKGFRFIEVVAPCSTLYGRLNKLGSGFDLMKFYHRSSVVHNGADTRDVDIDFQGDIICGKFIDREAPTYLEMMHSHYEKVLGDKYVPMSPEGGWIREQD
jgi:2-oxoglutarate ferredoxin oxidoreductase subunit beta